jgi:hypothetical protein
MLLTYVHPDDVAGTTNIAKSSCFLADDCSKFLFKMITSTIDIAEINPAVRKIES